jgi:DNA polymerase III subunit beta
MLNAALMPASSPNPASFSITIARAPLLKALGHLQSTVERRSTIPILSNVLLQSDGNFLKITATDMDMAVVETVPLEQGQAGGITVPVHRLHDIVRKLPDAPLTIDIAAAQATVRSGRSRFVLPTLPAEDFPQLADEQLPHQFTIDSALLVRLLDQVRFAMSTEETRYFLNGIYFHETINEAGSQVLRLVATDGHRMAMVETALPTTAGGMPGVILPRKTVQEMRKILEESGDVATISLSTTKCMVQAGSLQLTSKLVDGTYPDYRKVIPQHNDKILEVSADALALAVDRVATIASDKTRAIKWHLTSNNLNITSTNEDSSNAHEELDVGYNSDALDVGYNSRYLLDVLGQMSGASCRFILKDTATAIVVVDKDNHNALYVLMPMRV